MRKAHLFIRDDDVCTLDQKFQFFFGTAIDREIPVVYGVIPGKMDQKLIRFLCRAKEKMPHLLDIVQHGWVHTNHSLHAGTKYEFGASRTLEAQRCDIQLGLKQMRQAYGHYFTPAFVPPYHGYDERTLQVLQGEDFRIFSAGARRQKTKPSLIELPATVSFSWYDQNRRPSVHSAAEVVEMLARGIYRRALSGVVTHHADFTTVASRKELMRFFDLVVAMRGKMDWRVVLFSDILSQKEIQNRS